MKLLSNELYILTCLFSTIIVEISVLAHRKNQFHTIKFKKHTIKVKKAHNKVLKHTIKVKKTHNKVPKHTIKF